MSEALPIPPILAAPAPFEIERDFAGRQYVGRREKQEDYYAFSDVSEKLEPPHTKMLLALGDGLGAHIGGNVASYLLISEFIKAYKRSSLSTSWRLRVALEAANEALSALTTRLAWVHAPMGSTFLGMIISRAQVHWISVGDSPLYLYRAGRLERLNADHSLTPLLEARVRRGEMTPEQALVHPDRHVLQSACMGLPLTLVDARLEPTALLPGDILIAASDGVLTIEVPGLEQLLAKHAASSSGAIADAILDAIRSEDLPRQDNTTLAVVKLGQEISFIQ